MTDPIDTPRVGSGIVDEALIPCPFCGGAAKLQGPDLHTWIYVQCEGCGAKGTIVLAGHGGTSKEAIAAWNRRVSLPAVGGEPVAWEYEFFGSGQIVERWTKCVGLADPRATWGETMVRNVRPLYTSPASMERDGVLEEAAKVADHWAPVGVGHGLAPARHTG